jgi:hypothetical protein
MWEAAKAQRLDDEKTNKNQKISGPLPGLSKSQVLIQTKTLFSLCSQRTKLQHRQVALFPDRRRENGPYAVSLASINISRKLVLAETTRLTFPSALLKTIDRLVYFNRLKKATNK